MTIITKACEIGEEKTVQISKRKDNSFTKRPRLTCTNYEDLH